MNDIRQIYNMLKLNKFHSTNEKVFLSDSTRTYDSYCFLVPKKVMAILGSPNFDGRVEGGWRLIDRDQRLAFIYLSRNHSNEKYKWTNCWETEIPLEFMISAESKEVVLNLVNYLIQESKNLS
jgi:hypothetical protein